MQLKQFFIYCATKQKVVKNGTFKVLTLDKVMKPLRRQNQIVWIENCCLSSCRVNLNFPWCNVTSLINCIDLSISWNTI